MFKDTKTFRNSGHHAVLDSVVNHLHEVTGAAWATVQPASLAWAKRTISGPLSRLDPWREIFEDRREMFDRDIGAPDHQAEPTRKTMYAPARTNIDEMHTGWSQFLGQVDIVAPIAVATVDHDVTGFEQCGDFAHNRTSECRWHHDPHGPWRRHLADKFFDRGSTGRSCLDDVDDGLGIAVIPKTLMTCQLQPANQAITHTS